ncbi:serine hydrolase [Trichothermofontia sichuanensis B231]|uniref:serine hydrolase n=1 Tax=Trichothermofontia sichuanensis TaxID=3045816 RepID=UPI002247C6A7|nr:serine hydrolase [Trichothermofontia sichuanensis]UZQ52793.1 serine hydrolase [Trichothermofontia sichuanensis B231]
MLTTDFVPQNYDFLSTDVPYFSLELESNSLLSLASPGSWGSVDQLTSMAPLSDCSTSNPTLWRDLTFWGTPQPDVYSGGGGNDYFYGAQGDDMLCGNNGNDQLIGGTGNDRLVGGAGDDSLNGQAGTDKLWGRSGQDHLDGGSGRDQLNGGKGNDRLIDRDGGDHLTGGLGADQFWIGNGRLGVTQVTDFEIGRDRLRFLELGATFDQLTLRNTPAGVVLSYAGRELVQLLGITAAQVTADQLDFGAASLVSDLQTILNQVQQNPLFKGSTLSVVTPDGSFWHGASGFSDAETGQQMRPDDRLEIASATKPFVAVTVLQLVQEGKLSLDDSLSKWLPNVAQRLDNGNRATIRQLLNHTSGIVDYLDAFVSAVFVDPELQTKRWTAEQVLTYAYGKNSDETPGQYAYSNTNYVLLGLIIEKATGNSLAQQIRQRILQPLGMQNTFYAPQENVTGGYAPNYISLEGTPIELDTQVNPTLLGAGASGIVSTTADMSRFMQALKEGELLPPALFQQMREDGIPNQELRYGLGIFTYTQTGVGTIVGHNGGLLSNSQIFYLNDGTIVTALKNGFDRTDQANNEILYTEAFKAIRCVAAP